jgi:hypothetical protein
MLRRDVSIAGHRVIEAIRLHAAENGGNLPTSPDEITVVPVPDHPGFGEPFPYRVDGGTATLEVRRDSAPTEPFARSDHIFEITIREKENQAAPKENN